MLLPKKQHYIPQFYLKNFSINHNKSDAHLNVYDKIRRKYYESSVRDVSEENYFYTIKIANNVPAIAHFFSLA